MGEARKTALVLGGGGSRGAYEIGVWQALREMDLTIDIVVGSSVGAINGAMLAQNAFEPAAQLWRQLETDMVFELNPIKNSDPPLRSLLEEYINETAIRNSRIRYGLVTLELPSMIPHHLFISDIPQGKLIEFILASSSIFPVIKPQSIGNRKYVDGGYTDNLPVEMALKEGATHVIAVDLEVAGIVRKTPLKLAENLILIRPKAELGNMLIFKRENAERLIRLGYLETLKAFGFFSGSYFTFAKHSRKRGELLSAEAAGRIFGLDPGILYTTDSFDRALFSAANAYAALVKQDLDASRTRIRQKKITLDGLLSLLQKANDKTLALALSEFLSNNPQLPRETPLSGLFPAKLTEPWNAASYLLALEHKLNM